MAFNAYYEYHIDIRPGMDVGNSPYVTDVLGDDGEEIGITAPGSSFGTTIKARWIQFKIPITDYESKVGAISDFRSIRFMRMYVTDFTSDVTLRLERWIWYAANGAGIQIVDITDLDGPENDNTNFDVEAVNIEENSYREPIRYVSPPGVVREQLYNNNSVINQNEQSLVLRVAGDGLQAGDSRAVFKNISVDMRQFKKLKMFLHAESLPGEPDLADNEMMGFIRFGNDLTENFYQVEIPLKVTAPGAALASLVWPAENEIDLPLALLTKSKFCQRHRHSIRAKSFSRTKTSSTLQDRPSSTSVFAEIQTLVW
jgi:cell surface protein SprA